MPGSDSPHLLGGLIPGAPFMALLWAMLPLDPAWAFDAFTVDLGYGLEDTTLLRLNISTGDNRHSAADKDWYWSRTWETNISYWHLYKQHEGVQSLFELGLTPNVRLEREQPWGWARPYIEAGIGAHLLSSDRIGPRELGSSLLFGTHAGFGVRLGRKEQYELAWRIEHLSNAGLGDPNPGINFSMARFGYRW
jgi:hypothetical protein